MEGRFQAFDRFPSWSDGMTNPFSGHAFLLSRLTGLPGYQNQNSEDRDTESADRDGQAYWPGIESEYRLCTVAIRQKRREPGGSGAAMVGCLPCGEWVVVGAVWSEPVSGKIP